MVHISNLELIEILRKNARISYVDIAKRFGVSETAVRKRIRNLEERGIIKGYTAEIDPRQLGYKIRAMIGVDTKPESYVSVLEKLMGMEDLKSLYASSGDHMLLFEVWLEDSSELNRFVKDIESIPGVTKVCPALLVERIK
ncbi:transcriptional regulator [Candidatus Woesearchaeota archaeon]|nr:Lrp/AsnC family transcriptional regulator [Candidatus Woesearchaeota archaeon]RLE42315.1 MAG: transcriptional regulator [Candidatus Woesearchaeota archaeon]